MSKLSNDYKFKNEGKQILLDIDCAKYLISFENVVAISDIIICLISLRYYIIRILDIVTDRKNLGQIADLTRLALADRNNTIFYNVHRIITSKKWNHTNEQMPSRKSLQDECRTTRTIALLFVSFVRLD